MDKFGIFKLLNSFFQLNGQQKEQNTPESKQNGTSIGDILSALNSGFSSLKNTSSPTPPNNTEKQTVKTNVNKTNNNSHPPLQASMLSVMNSHDDFIKRVKQKHKV